MKNICVRCGKEFESVHKTAVCQECGTTAICVVCGKEFELKWPYTAKTCSSTCRGILRKESGQGKEIAKKAQETVTQKYDSPINVSLKPKKCAYCGKMFTPNSNRQKYCGDDYGECPVCGKLIKIKDMNIGPQACSKECKQILIEKTNLEKYGVKNVFQSEEAKEKSKETCLEKYGVERYQSTPEYREKYLNTMQERYGVDSPLQNEEIKEKTRNTIIEKYGVEWSCMREEARDYRSISKINKEFAGLLDKNNIKYKMEFPLKHYSYDFKIENIFIEINPTITHNSFMSIFNKGSSGKDKNYHRLKTDVAVENGYQCIHVFDWDNYDKIINILKPKESVYARNCIVQDVPIKECNEFLNKYHLQNTCKGQEIRTGLYYNDKLVQIMTFGKPRYNKNYEWELLRLCSNSTYAIVGGAEKLFKHFIDNVNPESIISYCDISKFSGEVYKRLNMKLVNTTSPNKIWSKGIEKITNNFLLQRGYDQLFGTEYGKGTSNEKLMLENGWLPVYDCGQNVYEYKCEMQL